MTFSADPNWLDATARLRQGVAPEIAHWLSDQGSLTRRVIKTCHGHFQVRVVEQSRGLPSYSERRILGRSGRETAVIRQVELCCNGRPWVFARTLIPLSSLTGRARQLAKLGSRPLGAVLFSDPGTRRLATQYARLDARYDLFHAATASLKRPPAELWGRRTLYSYATKPILVNEIFLPAAIGARPLSQSVGQPLAQLLERVTHRV